MLFFQSPSTSHKYFPELGLVEHEQISLQPIQSVSRLASEILRLAQGRITGNAEEFVNTKARSKTTASGSAPVAKLRALCRHGNAAEEEEKSFDPRLSSQETGEAKRRNSWNDMPKFLLAGAVSTVISRCAFLSSLCSSIEVSSDMPHFSDSVSFNFTFFFKDVCGTTGENKARVHCPGIKQMAEDCQIDLDFRRTERILERQHAQPLSYGAVQIHQLHSLRHVHRSPPQLFREQGDHESRQTSRWGDLWCCGHCCLPAP